MTDTIKADCSLAECISSLLSDRFTGDPVSDIRVIYKFLESADPQIRELLLANDGNPFREGFFHFLFTSEKCAFHSYCMDTETGRFTEAYLSCIPGIYESYRKAHPDDTDIDGAGREGSGDGDEGDWRGLKLRLLSSFSSDSPVVAPALFQSTCSHT